MDLDSRRLRVSVSDGAGRPVRDGGLAGWLVSVAPARARGEVSVALVSDAQVRSLNRRYRRRDQATDVLSFSTGSEHLFSMLAGPHPRSRAFGGFAPRAGRRRSPNPEPQAPSPGLGDIVIATGVARRQAKDAGHTVQAELRLLALHGLLHLLGYDHHDAQDRDRMARLETRLRRQGGLRSGLIERAAPRPAARRARA